MLSISIQLQYIIIAVIIGIAHAAFHSSGKPGINRKIHEIIASSGTDLTCVVGGAVIDHHIIILGIIPDQIVHYCFYTSCLIVGRNDHI